jgi:hypothetical protein
MYKVLLLSLSLLVPVAITAQAPAPQAQPPVPAQPRPAAPKPVAARPATPPARTAVAITVTDPKGATLPGIHVVASGPADREGDTDGSGMLHFTNVRPGTYRVRFSGSRVITFEREITVRAGQTNDVDVMLNLAPVQTPPVATAPQPPPPVIPAPPPPPPPAPVAPAVGPPGQPKVISILDLLDTEFVGRTPRRESSLGCSGNGRARMIQLNETLPDRLYDRAESFYYVLGGEGTIRMNGRDLMLTTGHFAMIPRGISHSFTRRGRRPLILLAVLSGEPCESSTAP